MSNNVGRTTDSGQASPLDDDKELEELLTKYRLSYLNVPIVDGERDPFELSEQREDAKKAIQAWAAKQAVEARINTLEAVLNDHAVAPDCYVEIEAMIKSLQQGENHETN